MTLREDGLDALVRAALQALAGVCDMASAGVIPVEEVVCANGRASLTVLPVGVALVEWILM